MTEHTKAKGGLSADEFLERESGGVHHNAVVLVDLGSALYGAEANWEFDTDTPEAVELVRLCREVSRYLADLSILPDGSLTKYRECRRCSGDGSTRGEDPCKECGGSGSIHADFADD
jgi:hypothetical protein